VARTKTVGNKTGQMSAVTIRMCPHSLLTMRWYAALLKLPKQLCVHWMIYIETLAEMHISLVMQRYIVQTIYRVDIGHIVSYRYR